MQRKEIYDLLNSNPVFFLSTVCGDKPKVRGMLLYRADENGIIFHTGYKKDVYKQVLANPNAELCFNDFNSNTQVRISGKLKIVKDNALRNEIASDPSRGFIQAWIDNGLVKDIHEEIIIMRLRGGKAKIWTMHTNFEPQEQIDLD